MKPIDQFHKLVQEAPPGDTPYTGNVIGVNADGVKIRVSTSMGPGSHGFVMSMEPGSVTLCIYEVNGPNGKYIKYYPYWAMRAGLRLVWLAFKASRPRRRWWRP